MPFENQLLKWYKKNKRDLPWRKNKDPYKVWISEIILQQTRVAQGEKYYFNFLNKFPSISRLASAKESEVLQVWKGLGYYNRAINLHKTSKNIMLNYGGVFPDSYEEIIKLRGVGDYTASAISSICFGQYNPVVDGNVLRFLSRYYGYKLPIDTTKAYKKIKKKGKQLIDRIDSPGDFNQAMMEFGALKCTPFPDCKTCSFNLKCNAFLEKKVDVIPLKSKKIKLKNRYLNYLVFIDKNNNTIVNQRIKKDIWFKLNEFPLIESKEEVQEITEIKSFKNFIELNNLTWDKLTVVERVKHRLSHQILNITFHKFMVNQDNNLNVHLSELNKYNFPVPITNFINKMLI